MSVLFISHSSSDNELAKELKEQLADQGHHSVFLDLEPEKGIVAGQSWERTLYTKLRACRAVIALCTDSYLSSHWCFAEIALARMEGKHIFTLIADPFNKQNKLPSILTEHQYIDLRTGKETAYQELWRGFKAKGIETADSRDWNPKNPPYPGLLAFQEKDEAIFFGRDHEVSAGIELLNSVWRQAHPRLVLTLGASGSGKSSIVRAGLMPRLRRDAEQWILVDPFRPGTDPARELAVVFSRAFERTGHTLDWQEIHKRLIAAPTRATDQPAPNADMPEASAYRGAGSEFVELICELETRLPEQADPRLTRYLRLLRELAEQPDAFDQGRAFNPNADLDENPILALATELKLTSRRSGASVLLVVDQFEELLGQDAPDHPANRFLAMLRDAMEEKGSPVLVLATIRSDFLASFQQNRILSGIGFKTLSVGPIPMDEMRKIVDEPAKLGAIQLENGLTDLLLNDTETSDALPLLAFTLRVMWEKYIDFDQGDRLLEVREYKDLGRLQGAVAKEADEVLEAALREGKEKELKNAFLRMARITEEGNFARRPVLWDTLPVEVHPMLQRFVDKRLLVSRGDGTLEVAHEALFRSWDRLKGWLGEDREFLLWQQRIRASVANWVRSDRDEGGLLRGAPLAEAEGHLERRLGELTEDERVFVEHSIKLREREEQAKEQARQERELLQKRSNRRLKIFLCVALMLMAVSAVFFFQARQSAEEARQSAQQAQDERKKTVNEIIKASWKAGSLVKVPENWVFGVRGIYEALRVVVDLEKLQSLSPVPVFASGPHQSEFDFQSGDFGRYNPDFVVWAQKTLIPAASNYVFRNATQPVYDKFIRDMARTYYVAYLDISKDIELLRVIEKEYLERVEDYKSRELDEKYDPKAPGEYIQEVFRPYATTMAFSGYDWYFSDVAASFWVRRNIDGTAGEFFKALETLLNTYDQEFLETTIPNQGVRKRISAHLIGTWESSATPWTIKFNADGTMEQDDGQNKSTHSWNISAFEGASTGLGYVEIVLDGEEKVRIDLHEGSDSHAASLNFGGKSLMDGVTLTKIP